jgi:MYXO-CTERM domain-containing protein
MFRSIVFATHCSIVTAAVLGLASSAHALEQPNGAKIPSDMGCDGGKPTGLAAEFACVCDQPGQCNIGAVCPSEGNCPMPTGNCETTLWHSFNDNTCIPSNLSGLDPWQDGASTPETFTPTCPLTFTVVTRGTAMFKDVFGWYNVTGEKPAISDLHVMLGCGAPAKISVDLDVRNHPDYLGGEVGFFLATPEDRNNGSNCAGGDCCATLDRVAAGDGYIYYSQSTYNPDAAGENSYKHLVIYDSVITERKFYFAWEDIFGGSNNDFTDIVTSVEGVECAGAGESCDTGIPGTCAHGITVCRGDQIECVQLFDAENERCNRADDDCDGEIDEDPAQCDDDVYANCEDVTCPAGQVCRNGGCMDPCDGVQCGDGEACRGGLCFPGCNQCNGLICAAGSTCMASGECSGESGPSFAPDGGPGNNVDNNDDGDGGEATAVGCGCSSTSGGAPSLFLLALLALWFRPARARRRR